MPYTIGYSLTYQELSGEIVEVNIYDTESWSDDEMAITFSLEIRGTDTPFVRSFIDNDRNKFKPIRAQKAEINIKSQNDGISAATFATGGDHKWYVEAHIQKTLYSLFKGHLVMDDFQEPFLPPTTYTYKLTAIDGLGTLKEQPLTKPDGTNPRGYFKVIEYIAWCLQKTGLNLDIVVTDTWMEEHQTTFSPWYNHIYLWSKTFEDQINTSVNCYKVLEMIFGYNCSIQLVNGKWWISHVDERSQNQTYKFLFNYLGVYQGQLNPEQYQQIIGKDEVIKLIEEDAMRNWKRPYKYVKLKYSFSYPREIVDNIDFSQGDFVNYNAGTRVANYTISHWTYEKSGGGSPSPSVAYITKEYYDDNQTYEKERYINLTPSATSGLHWIRSNKIPVGQKDKFTFSVDRRLNRDMSFGGQVTEFIAQIRLYGDDGTYWTVTNVVSGTTEVEGTWVRSNSSFTTNNRFIQVTYPGTTTNERDWMNASVESLPTPVSGEIEILLIRVNATAAYSVAQTHFANLQFTYTPYINGSYSKYTSQHHKVSQAEDNNANVDDDVFVADAPRKLFKGAFFRKVGDAYILTEKWFAGGDLLNQGIQTPPMQSYMHPFGQLQIFAVWNQYNRRMIELSGSVKGMKLDSYNMDVPDINWNYTINTPELSTKRFMPCDKKDEYRSEKWTVVLLETVDTQIDKDYSSDHEFKFEQ